jgi:hypothetical protein
VMQLRHAFRCALHFSAEVLTGTDSDERGEFR